MPVQYSEIQELLRSRADLHARLNLMPYDGTPEIKERGDKKRLFLRKSLFEYIKLDRDKSTFKSHRDFSSEKEISFKHF